MAYNRGLVYQIQQIYHFTIRSYTKDCLYEKGFWLEPRSIVAIAVCLLALAEIVDLTIVAVAIPTLWVRWV